MVMTGIRLLRLVLLLEGVSFLVLLFIAMPLKYFADAPLAVRIVGSVHGFLFLVLLYVLLRTHIDRAWPVRRTMYAFASSLVPFGTFVFDRSLRMEIAGLESGRAGPTGPVG
jgi:integral membrane protein